MNNLHNFWEKIFLLTFLASFSISCSTLKIEKTPDEILNEMSLEEKVAQMFVVRLEQIDPSISLEELRGKKMKSTTSVNRGIKKNYEKYPIGGITLFKQNIESEKQIKKLVSDIHNLGKNSVQPYVFIDEEGGIVTRLASKNNFNLPIFSNMGELTSSEESITERKNKIFDVGKKIGSYLKDFGFDVDFAPVCDVNTNPYNPIIGTRAFSNDPIIAGELSISFLQGLNKSGVKGCLKHFPGHGDTSTDTHLGFAKSEKNWDELLACEMIPFKKGIDSGAKMIMTAHISLPNVTGSNIPSTLSEKILTRKLREELCFDGVIITDAMEMGAISKMYDSGTAAVKAIQAGADIVLMPFDFQEAYETVLKVVKEGIITEERINESVKRILDFKLSFY